MFEKVMVFATRKKLGISIVHSEKQYTTQNVRTRDTIFDKHIQQKHQNGEFHTFQYYWNLMNINNRNFLSKFSIKIDPYTNG
jgi:ribosome-associated toxin RatA of RatAB toxin-antitoxin module